MLGADIYFKDNISVIGNNLVEMKEIRENYNYEQNIIIDERMILFKRRYLFLFIFLKVGSFNFTNFVAKQHF